MRALSATGLTLFIAACGGQSTATPAPPTPAAPADGAAAAAPAESGAIEIYEDDQVVMILEGDGELKIPSEGGVIGTLREDNSITVSGRTARLHDDGTITVDGAEMPFTIGPDATASGPGMPTVTLEDDGSISGQSANARPLRVEGADTPEARRRAMFVLLLASMPAPADPAEQGAGAEPARAAEPAVEPGADEDEDAAPDAAVDDR